MTFKVVQFTSQITSTSNKFGDGGAADVNNPQVSNADPTSVSFQWYFTGYTWT